ncbi:methionyl-tRNA synthetase, partial [mine drainage metagenome]
TAGFVYQHLDGRLAETLGLQEAELWRVLVSHFDNVPALYAEGEFAEITRNFVLMADLVNGYIADRQPWKIAKDESRRAELHQICTIALSAFRLLAAWIKPILPATVASAEEFLAKPIADFSVATTPLLGHRINAFTPLLGRVDRKQVETMVATSTESLQPAASAAEPKARPMNDSPASASSNSDSAGPGAASVGPGSFISIDDFARLDLRIGTVLACEFVEGSDKLLRFELDVGEMG